VDGDRHINDHHAGVAGPCVYKGDVRELGGVGHTGREVEVAARGSCGIVGKGGARDGDGATSCIYATPLQNTHTYTMAISRTTVEQCQCSLLVSSRKVPPWGRWNVTELGGMANLHQQRGCR
jgi:hypothetical protein